MREFAKERGGEGHLAEWVRELRPSSSKDSHCFVGGGGLYPEQAAG